MGFCFHVVLTRLSGVPFFEHLAWVVPTGGAVLPGNGPWCPVGGEEWAGAAGGRNGERGAVKCLLAKMACQCGREEQKMSCQKPNGIKGLFCDRSDYEEMPLQNGQAIRAQYKEGSESD